MANLDAPMGLSPLRNPHGNTIPVETFTVTSGQAVAPGTLVYLTSAGTIQAWDGTATGRTAIVGVALGYISTSATDRVVEVAVDPAQEYEAQIDDNSITAETDFLGANFTLVNNTTVDATLGQSRGEIDGSSASTANDGTTIRPLKALRASRAIDDDLTLANNRLVVKINPVNHLYANDTGVL